jgi:hypothetical protein
MNLERNFTLTNMLANIPIGQQIGGCIWNLFLIALGAYIVWRWPNKLQSQVQAGKLSEAKAKEQLKKFSPRLGYLVIIVGIVCLVRDFIQ